MVCEGIALSLPHPVQFYYSKYMFYRDIEEAKYVLIHLAPNSILSCVVVSLYGVNQITD